MTRTSSSDRTITQIGHGIGSSTVWSASRSRPLESGLAECSGPSNAPAAEQPASNSVRSRSATPDQSSAHATCSKTAATRSRAASSVRLAAALKWRRLPAPVQWLARSHRVVAAAVSRLVRVGCRRDVSVHRPMAWQCVRAQPRSRSRVPQSLPSTNRYLAAVTMACDVRWGAAGRRHSLEPGSHWRIHMNGATAMPTYGRDVRVASVRDEQAVVDRRR